MIEVKKNIYLLDKNKNIAIFVLVIALFLYWQSFETIYMLFEKPEASISITWLLLQLLIYDFVN